MNFFNLFVSKNDPEGNFIEKFGTKYEAQKNKLKNDLHQEYNEYLQKVNIYIIKYPTTKKYTF